MMHDRLASALCTELQLKGGKANVGATLTAVISKGGLSEIPSLRALSLVTLMHGEDTCASCSPQGDRQRTHRVVNQPRGTQKHRPISAHHKKPSTFAASTGLATSHNWASL